MTLTRSIPDTLVTTYLEMTDRSQLNADYADDYPGSIRIVRMDTADVPFYRFLYDSVGDQWAWRDRRLMSDAELETALAQASVYVLYVDGVPAGYVELAPNHAENSTEIAYFGLRPAYMGRGLGKYLLSFGVARAWDEGAQRVTVHTCNNDAPQALPNYLKRGFRVHHTEAEPMPDRYRS